MKASCSMFSQILKLIPRTDFERIVKETGAEYRSKGLSSWSQFVGMLFCQWGRAHSLREIEGGLKSCERGATPSGTPMVALRMHSHDDSLALEPRAIPRVETVSTRSGTAYLAAHAGIPNAVAALRRYSQ